MQLYDEWQHQGNVLLIDGWSTSRSAAMPLGCSANLIGVFWEKNLKQGRANQIPQSKQTHQISFVRNRETDLQTVFCFVFFLIKKKKQTGLGEETQTAAPHTNSHLNLPLCKEQDLWPLFSNTAKFGGWMASLCTQLLCIQLFASCLCVHAVYLSLNSAMCLLQWKPLSSSSIHFSL